jgi:pantoate--beta-alanine ligase
MQIANTVSDLHRLLNPYRERDSRVAFVPTMGNLHEGHRRLMRAAREHGEAVVASIYVNPLQFGANEDFTSYPRTPADDIAALQEEGVDLLFMPGDADMYPRGQEQMTRVEVPGLGDILCGASRPGHFRGVTTVVNRLFNLVQPRVAVFGKKDYQQLFLIRRMVDDLGIPVSIVGAETVRDADGLALSSRNAYLSPDERRAAPRLYAALVELAAQIRRSRAFRSGLIAPALEHLRAAGFRPDYLSVRRAGDLGEAGGADRELVILAAAWLGRTRLIDNLELTLPS